MNNEAEPQPTLLDDATASSAPLEDIAVLTSQPLGTRRSSARGSRRRKARLVRTKVQFLNHLLRSLDVLLYYYFSYAYFLDTSFLRFILRCAIQLNFLTPKPSNFPHSPQRRSVLYGIFGTAIFCILCHSLNSEPSAGEATTGYLHGGLLIDFVGQEGPISKFRLVATDLTILGLQIFMLSVSLEKHLLKSPLTPPASMPSQDLDSEERGELAQANVAADISGTDVSGSSEDDGEGNQSEPEEGGDIDQEMPLPHQRRERPSRRRRQRSGGSSDGGEEDEAPSSSLEDRDVENPSQYNAYSGQLVVANVRFIDAIRMQWNYGNPPEFTPLGTTNETPTLLRENTARDEALSILTRLNAQRQTAGF